MRRRKHGVLLTLLLGVLAAAAILLQQHRGFLTPFLPAGNDVAVEEGIRVPPGFHLTLYAANVPGARSMALGSGGTLFVGTRREGKVYALVDADKDYRAERVITLAEGLNMPNGVAVRNGALYVAEIHRLLRFADIERRLEAPPPPEVLRNDYPTETHHGWRYLAFGPDGKLYVPIGVPCNVCSPDNPLFGTITRLNSDGSGREIVARGVRNSVGFDWHPQSGELWFTDNGRDWLGDDRPPDELNHAPQAGLHFGFPHCHGKAIIDPEFGRDCSRFTPPVLELGPHVASLGMRFYRGEQFPPRYRHGIFIAEHGSWNRSEPIGYRVMFVPLHNQQPQGYEIFAEGWLKDGAASGRPVDILQLPDGSLLVSDDKGGRIYRIAYTGD